MSVEGGDELGQSDFATISDLAVEPSYVSEIARKLQENSIPRGVNFDNLESLEVAGETWDDLRETTAVALVAKALGVLWDREDGNLSKERVEYDNQAGGELLSSQEIGSTHQSLVDGESDEWQLYSVYHNPDEDIEVGNVWEVHGWESVADNVRDAVDGTVSVDEKMEVTREVSRRGNRMSKWAEMVMQDVMSRQFRGMEDMGFSGYNDPGNDFWVVDKFDKEYGIVVEVSTRWVNPVGKPYIESKKDAVLDMEGEDEFGNSIFDLLLLAPRFSGDSVTKYDGSDIVHLDKVPNLNSQMYRQFLDEGFTDAEMNTGGSPVIIPDSQKARDRLAGVEGHVGDRYPVVSEEDEEYIRMLDMVNRDFKAITESGYRSQLRESLEPLLPRFSRPYQIEQYLIDTYWEKGLDSPEIGRLNDVSGRTILRWMQDKNWDVVRRGTLQGEPEGRAESLKDRTVEVWKAMYRGDPPFDEKNPGGFSAYTIQSLYSRHPLWDLEDWELWFDRFTEEQRETIMTSMDTSRSGYSYTFLFGPEDNIRPSTDFILDTLREEGVEIREGYFGVAELEPTAKSVEYMLNLDVSRLDLEEDLVRFRSASELEVAEWFSDNQIPYAYEPFTIPSTYTGQSAWDEITGNIVNEEGVAELWREIYNKHALDEEGDVGVEEGLELFEKTEIVPDFVVYSGSEQGVKERGWEGWDDWTKIVEYVGPWGMEIIGDGDWESWYRVRQVAYKELVFKILGLWDDVIMLMPNNDGITDEIRGDDNYVIVNSTQMGTELEKLADRLGN